jgi:hypothetical protein
MNKCFDHLSLRITAEDFQDIDVIFALDSTFREHATPECAVYNKPSSAGKSKIVFCGREIEIDDEVHEYQRLPPSLVKTMWRNEQILAQQRLHAEDETRSKSIFGRKKTHAQLSSGTSVDSDLLAPAARDNEDSRSPSKYDECLKNCAHAVWSGWVRMKDSGPSNFVQPWQAFWSVLNIERRQVRLDLHAVEGSSSSMRAARSIIVDPSRGAMQDRPILACGTCARLSIWERESGRRHRLACESPEDAKQLHKCVNALLGSLVGET